MPLIKDATELKEYIFTNPKSLEDQWFILAHAPYCARMIDPRTPDGKIYMEILNKMFQAHEYTIPFYYIGYLKFNSQNTSASDCKGFLRSMCNDLDRITKWFSINGCNIDHDPNYIKNITPIMTEYIKTFISGVRKKQLEIGANESAMINYAPIIPYTYNITRESEIINKPETQKFIEETLEVYDNVLTTNDCSMLSDIAMKLTNSIIDYINYPFEIWKVPMDIFSTIAFHAPTINNDLLRYLIIIWLMNNNHRLTYDELVRQYRDFITFKLHSMNPLKPTEFKDVFESMCLYTTGSIDDMMSIEAWSALSEDSQELADKFLENIPKTDKPIETYDLDALLAEFYTMRHVETNDYTNQFFLAELPGLKINSYNYINDDIMICEINSNYLVIPYVDIACDYKVKIIGINKVGEITIWESIDDIKK